MEAKKRGMSPEMEGGKRKTPVSRKTPSLVSQTHWEMDKTPLSECGRGEIKNVDPSAFFHPFFFLGDVLFSRVDEV